jgi:hypothetical protein
VTTPSLPPSLVNGVIRRRAVPWRPFVILAPLVGSAVIASLAGGAGTGLLDPSGIVGLGLASTAVVGWLVQPRRRTIGPTTIPASTAPAGTGAQPPVWATTTLVTPAPGPAMPAGSGTTAPLGSALSSPLPGEAAERAHPEEAAGRLVFGVSAAAVVVALAGLIVATVRGDIGLVAASKAVLGGAVAIGALGFLGAVAVGLWRGMREALASEGPPRIESHWGGFGGGVGGWNVSRSFFYFFGFIVAIGAIVVVATQTLAVLGKLPSQVPPSSVKTDEPSKKPAAVEKAPATKPEAKAGAPEANE